MTTITIDTLADSRGRAQAEPRMETPASSPRLVLSMLIAQTVEGRAMLDTLEFVVSSEHRGVLAAGLREAADMLEAQR